MITMRTLLFAGISTLLITILTACGSSTAGIARPGEIDVRKLDVGSFPTLPPNAHDDDYRPGFAWMNQIAAMRLADQVVSAYDIDPRLTHGIGIAGSFESDSIPFELGDTITNAMIARRNHLLFGFRSNGADRQTSLLTSGWPSKTFTNTTIVSTIVMQFADVDGAKQAATDLYQADLAALGDQNKAVTLPKYPGAQSHWRPGSPFMRTMLTHGQYLVAFLVSTPAVELGALTTLAEKAYDTQLPLLDKLPALTDEEMLQLPWDPDRLLTRALNPTREQNPSSNNSFGLYGQRGMRHFATDREFVQKQLTAMKADRFATSAGTVVARTSDEAIARNAVANRLTLTHTRGEAAAPPNVPDAACVENQVPPTESAPIRFTCIVAYHEYIGIVGSSQITDAHQRAAAQYALFANTR